MKKIKLITLVVASFYLLVPSSAFGATYICNQSSQEHVYLAISYKKADQWISQGWFLARSGRCATFSKKTDSDAIYYFAYSQSKTQSWEGKQPFCVASKPFEIKQAKLGTTSCKGEGQKVKNFKRIVVEGFTDSEVYLAPKGQVSIKAVPYHKADATTLSIWASQGDRSADQEIKKRMGK